MARIRALCASCYHLFQTAVNFRYPIFLDVSGKKCLVAGEGYEIPAKVRGLVDALAVVTYVNPRAEALIADLANTGLIEWRARKFQPEDLNGCFLVIADSEKNAEIFRLAEEKNILCNSVDDPANCRFSFGSVHRQGDLMMAISTNGIAPAIAVRLREWLSREIGPEYAGLLEILRRVRKEISERIGSFDARRKLWYHIADSDALAMLRHGEREPAEKLIRELIEAASDEKATQAE